MKKSLTLFKVLLLMTLSQTEASFKNFTCESIKLSNSWRPLFHLTTCFMTKTTSINSHEFSFESLKHENVTGLSFEGNKKIVYLPIKLYENFPNLFGIDASNCAIKKIANDNFRGLKFLKQLWLRGNAIEIISSDTFENLQQLEYLSLARNNIRIISSQSFRNLENLRMVSLSSNECINESFDGKQAVKRMPLAFVGSCDFFLSQS